MNRPHKIYEFVFIFLLFIWVMTLVPFEFQ